MAKIQACYQESSDGLNFASEKHTKVSTLYKQYSLRDALIHLIQIIKQKPFRLTILKKCKNYLPSNMPS